MLQQASDIQQSLADSLNDLAPHQEILFDSMRVIHLKRYSFLMKNSMSFSKCIPDLWVKPTIFQENNNLPFDTMINNIQNAWAENNDLNKINVKSIFYEKKEDFDAYQTFRCINQRTTLSKPNLEFCSSDEFCMEALA